jgi:hypothetical protein
LGGVKEEYKCHYSKSGKAKASEGTQVFWQKQKKSHEEQDVGGSHSYA